MIDQPDQPDQPAADSAGADESAAPARPARARAIIGSLSGLALFAAAIWAIASQRETLASGLDAARHAPWWLVLAVVVLPLANWLVISESFRVLTGRYARVGRAEMAGLIASAWLLNYLPMKPGMLGRIAYHKHVNGVRYADSARVVGFGLLLTGVSLGILIVVALLVRTAGPAWIWCSVPAMVLGLASIVTRSRGPWAGRLVYGAFLRYLDSMIWVCRYAAAFALVGAPLDFADSVTVAAVSQVALLIPVSGNGLGVREWGVRLVTSPAGLLADLVNRAAEVAVALPLGIAGSLWSARKLREHAAITRESGAQPPPPEPGTNPA